MSSASTGDSEQSVCQQSCESDAARPPAPRRRFLWRLILAIFVIAAGAAAAAYFLWFASPIQQVKIAVHASLTGKGGFSGKPLADAIRMAEREVKARGADPRIRLMKTEDDRSSTKAAADIAERIGATDAALVIGPSLTPTAEAAAPAYQKAGLAVLVATPHGDGITRDKTTGKANTSFLMTASTSDMGEALATYLNHVLGKKNAVVILTGDTYGQTFEAGFKNAAGQSGISAVYYTVKARDKSVAIYRRPEREKRDAIVRAIISDPERPAVVFGMTQDSAKPFIVKLRRAGYGDKEPILGTTSMSRSSFAEMFEHLPEDKAKPGFFADGIYAASPVMLDSANAATLDFARRFRARYGKEPSWEAVQSYDTFMLAAEAIRAVAAKEEHPLPPREMRSKLLEYWKSSGAGLIAKSLSGGIWLKEEQRRQQTIRIGRYQGKMFKSALVQLVPVSGEGDDKTASSLVDLGRGQYARRQHVVYTGVHLIEIPRLNLTQPSFTADFYLWMRYQPETAGPSIKADCNSKTKGEKELDPENIVFPDAVQGLEKIDLQSKLLKGICYRLWHIRGEFKNGFDFHRFPLDNQTLTLRFVNSSADSSQIVYVKDRDETGVPEFEPFRNLTQWNAIRTGQQRYASSTQSDLGSGQGAGLEQGRELSGYNLTVELQRSVVSALTKTLMPLAILTLIMWASLFFPHGMVNQTVTVVITVALSGTVLLSSINAQLGDVGYILAVEYVFYLYFALCLFSMAGVLAAERLRSADSKLLARKTIRTTRLIFALAIVAAIGAGWLVSERWRSSPQAGPTAGDNAPHATRTAAAMENP